MIVNGNSGAINNFENVPMIPNQIINTLLDEKSEEAENFWKLLYYGTDDALSKRKLKLKEKVALIWAGDSLENNYRIFYKPLIGSALDTASSQTQMRLYRTTSNPTSKLDCLINFEIVFTTNEK